MLHCGIRAIAAINAIGKETAAIIDASETYRQINTVIIQTISANIEQMV